MAFILIIEVIFEILLNKFLFLTASNYLHREDWDMLTKV